MPHCTSWQPHCCHRSNWLAQRLAGIHFKLSPRFQGSSLAAALPIRASGGFRDNPTSSSVLWKHSDLKQQAGPGVSDFKFASQHFLLLHHPCTRSTMFKLFRKVSATNWSLIPREHFTLSVSVSQLHSQSSWNTSYVLSWNASCFTMVILLSIHPELKYQLAAFESFNLIHFHFFSIAWMIEYIRVVSF